MATFGPQGGGKALPPYLQGRAATQPMITPKSTVAPGEVKPVAQAPAAPAAPAQAPAAPAITPAANPTAAQMSAQPKAPAAQPQSLYEFFKSDLERQRNAAIANARSDASKRGVFYGTPLTTSEGDIETEFQRGLGALQGNLMQHAEENQMNKLRLAAQLGLFGGDAEAAGMDKDVFAQLGALLTPRGGPSVTPAPQRGNRTQSQ
jgi:hypothetical protein